MEQLNALMRQREAVLRRMKCVQDEIKTSAAVPNNNLRNLHFLKFQLSKIEGAYAKFGEYQEKIYAMALSENEQTKHEQVEAEFEAQRRELTLKLNELIETLQKSVPTTVVPQYLPPLNVPLPTFDGTCETWYTFKSMFQNVMARYTAETPAIKLYHLRNSLVGKAAGVIDQDIVNGNDYEMAWAILEERYEDKRAIVDKHIDALYALSKISHDNAAELRTLIDTCLKHIEALKALQLPVDGLGEQMLVNLLASRMDYETRRAWESGQKIGVLPTYAATIAFLKERCRVLERVEPYGKSCSTPQRSVALVVADGASCSMCDQQHELENCELFKATSVNEKFSHLRQHGLCFNCLRKGHRAGECSMTNLCQKCTRRHHTMMHSGGTKKPEASPKSTMPVAPTPKDWRRASKLAGCAETKKVTLLPTAVVRVYGEDGAPHDCRTLIDSCSQNNFMTERFANQLAVKKKRVDCEVSGLNSRRTRISHLVSATIKSRVGDFAADLELLVAPKITGDVPVKKIDIAGWDMPELELADPNFNKTGPVDMLLGAGVFWDLLKAGKIALADGLPSLRETELGWVVGGALPIQRDTKANSFCGISISR